MAKLNPTRTAQYPQVAEFVWNHNAWVVDSADGVKKTLGSTVALSTDPNETGLTGPVANTIVLDAIPMPIGALIQSGEIIVETAVTGSTAYTVSLGIAGSTTALLNAQSALAITRAAFTSSAATAALCSAGQNLRATIAYTVANATAGKIRLRVQYTVDSRAMEVVTA